MSRGQARLAMGGCTWGKTGEGGGARLLYKQGGGLLRSCTKDWMQVYRENVWKIWRPATSWPQRRDLL